MNIDLKAVLSNQAINGSRLFWLVCIPMSIIMVIAMLGADLSTSAGVRTMIQLSVRWAVPFIYLVVAASAVQMLFPGPFTAWWLRNREFFGLCFAVAMAWQALFIYILSTTHREYYFEEVYLFRDELEGSIGFIFLAAMVATTTQFGRKLLSPTQWKLLHTSALYFLWAYPMSTYWWSLFYYKNPDLIDYVYYWGGFLAFALRIAAWGIKRRPQSNTTPAIKALGGAMITFGLIAALPALQWQQPVTAFLTTPQWSAELMLWFPFWPYEPFLALFCIGLGTLLLTSGRAQARNAVNV